MSAATVRTVGRAGAPARPAAPTRPGSPRTAGSTRATNRPASSRPATSRPTEGPRRTAALRLVPQAPSHAARAPFVGVVVGLLALGLLGLLALNTSLAESSFRLHALQGQATVLADREQVLRQEVEALQAPEALAARAEALGMVPGGPPAFLRLSDGAVLGEPTPAPAGSRLRSPSRGAEAGSVPGVPGVQAPAVAVSPAPERRLSRAPAQGDDREGGASGTRSATGSGTQQAGPSEGRASEGRASEVRASKGRASEVRASEVRASDEPASGGAVDDGAVDADSTSGDGATADSTAEAPDAPRAPDDGAGR